MLGLAGKILRVDLTTGKVEAEPLDERVARKYIGGRGLAARILYDEVKPGIDPLGPDNRFIIATGPFSSAVIPGGTRYVTACKSPLTGGWGEANAAGRFGPLVKRSGFDAIVFQGKAERPVYLWVDSGRAELRDASHLWGKSIGDTRDQVLTETNPDAEVAAIGPAGENGVRFACVISEYNRAAGRTGTGAVMGSKNLKAVAVYGRERPPVANKERLDSLRKAMVQMIMESPACRGFRENGTPGAVVPHNTLGMYPAYNFREGVSNEIDRVSGETMTRTILSRRDSCEGCPVACRRVVKVEDDRFTVDSRYGGPEFETIGSLGTCVGVYDLAAISKANELCNKLGLDTIDMGISIAWAMECYERGILTREDTGGLDLTWGNVDAVLELIEQTVLRQGFGRLLGEGLKVASARVGKGSEAFAMQVKNQAFPVHMPRGKIGQGLSFATSNRGASHTEGMHDTSLEAGKTMPDIGFDDRFKGLSRLSKQHKPEIEVLGQNLRGIQDSLIVCRFVSWDYGPTPPQHLVDILNAMTGWDVTVQEFMTIGERVFNLCRMFNVREGMSRKDDTLPARCGESLPRGATAGSVITSEDLNAMLDEYYRLRGWDGNGIPGRERLAKLDLEVE